MRQFVQSYLFSDKENGNVKTFFLCSSQLFDFVIKEHMASITFPAEPLYQASQVPSSINWEKQKNGTYKNLSSFIHHKFPLHLQKETKNLNLLIYASSSRHHVQQLLSWMNECACTNKKQSKIAHVQTIPRWIAEVISRISAASTILERCQCGWCRLPVATRGQFVGFRSAFNKPGGGWELTGVDGPLSTPFGAPRGLF